MALKMVGRTSRGYTLYREENQVGGFRYWSDEIGGGVMVWDTSLGSPETLLMCLALEAKFIEEFDDEKTS